MPYDALILLLIGGIAGMCVKNTIDLGILSYKVSQHLEEEDTDKCQTC